ncbi:MAG TPA: hypothetical protein PKO41_04150 [Dokdonella sp.]|nr:hypothetical protein [Dokdonella sp.]
MTELSMRELASRQVSKLEDQRARNRELIKRAMPSEFEFLDQLQVLGMFGRMTDLEIFEEDEKVIGRKYGQTK